ncbi:serglycin [Apteryx mantelli]|uniref:Serglycin n=1 Tax=Apteryx mantelli TaxID=2696672 RepID=A0A8B7IQI3_9AVES|nr:PREDICTED: serglycin [Apteryx mantelli mantelli]XP_025910674.1 serglycin [Apteryx rowi]
MQAKMQLLIGCNGRIFMALCIILFVAYTAQGVPLQKARYKRVRCRPDAWSANCIEEKGPWFYTPEGGANRILPPMADPSLMKDYQELASMFPLSEDESGSGSEDVAEVEQESGSGADFGNDYPSMKFPNFLVGKQKSKLKQKLTEEDLIL